MDNDIAIDRMTLNVDLSAGISTRTEPAKTRTRTKRTRTRTRPRTRLARTRKRTSRFTAYNDLQLNLQSVA